MELQDLKESLQTVFSQYTVPILLGGISLFSIVCAVILLVRSGQTVEPIEFVMGESTSSATLTTETFLTIDINGGVIHPGVYQLPDGSRIEDAIKKAGGLSEEASLTIIGTQINRAQKLRDGTKVYIPLVKDEEKTSHIEGIKEEVDTSHNINIGDEGSTTMSINSASSQELETLSGVGPATAKKIIDSRPYVRLEELVSKKAVGQKLFDKIKNRLSL